MITSSQNNSSSERMDRNNLTYTIKKTTRNIVSSSGIFVTSFSTAMSEHAHPQERVLAIKNLLKQGSEFIQSFSHFLTKNFLFPLLPSEKKDTIVSKKKTLQRVASMSVMVVSEASKALAINQIATAPEVTFQGAIMSGVMTVGQGVTSNTEIKNIAKKTVRSVSGKFKQIKRSSSTSSLNL